MTLSHSKAAGSLKFYLHVRFKQLYSTFIAIGNKMKKVNSTQWKNKHLTLFTDIFSFYLFYLFREYILEIESGPANPDIYRYWAYCHLRHAWKAVKLSRNPAKSANLDAWPHLVMAQLMPFSTSSQKILTALACPRMQTSLQPVSTIHTSHIAKYRPHIEIPSFFYWNILF